MQDPGMAFKVLNNADLSSQKPSPPFPLPPPTNAPTAPVSVPPAVQFHQDLYFTLAIAGGAIVVIALLRPILAWLYSRFARAGSPMHPLLRGPALEILIAGLLLVAVTLYSCLTLAETHGYGSLGAEQAPRSWQAESYVAVAVLGGLVLPYAAFLWWLALAGMLGGVRDYSSVRLMCIPVLCKLPDLSYLCYTI